MKLLAQIWMLYLNPVNQHHSTFADSSGHAGKSPALNQHNDKTGKVDLAYGQIIVNDEGKRADFSSPLSSAV